MSDFVSGASVLFGTAATMKCEQTEYVPVIEPIVSEEVYQVRSPRGKTSRRRVSEKCINSPYLAQPFQMKPIPPIVKVKPVKSRTQPLSARRFEIPTLQQRRYKTFEAQDLGYVERKKVMDKQTQNFFNDLKANCQYTMRQETNPYEIDQNYARNRALRRSEVTKREREEMDVLERQSHLVECQAAMREELKRKPRSSYNDEMYHGQCASLRFIPVTDRLNKATGAAYVHI